MNYCLVESGKQVFLLVCCTVYFQDIQIKRSLTNNLKVLLSVLLKNVLYRLNCVGFFVNLTISEN